MLLEYFLIFLLITLVILWMRALFLIIKKPKKNDTVSNNKKDEWGARTPPKHIEVLEPCVKCGVYYSNKSFSGNIKICNQCKK